MKKTPHGWKKSRWHVDQPPRQPKALDGWQSIIEFEGYEVESRDIKVQPFHANVFHIPLKKRDSV